MANYWKLNPLPRSAKLVNFGSMLPNGRNAYGMSKDDIYFAMYGKTEKQTKKDAGTDA